MKPISPGIKVHFDAIWILSSSRFFALGLEIAEAEYNNILTAFEYAVKDFLREQLFSEWVIEIMSASVRGFGIKHPSKGLKSH